MSYGLTRAHPKSKLVMVHIAAREIGDSGWN